MNTLRTLGYRVRDLEAQETTSRYPTGFFATEAGIASSLDIVSQAISTYADLMGVSVARFVGLIEDDTGKELARIDRRH